MDGQALLALISSALYRCRRPVKAGNPSHRGRDSRGAPRKVCLRCVRGQRAGSCPASAPPAAADDRLQGPAEGGDPSKRDILFNSPGDGDRHGHVVQSENPDGSPNYRYVRDPDGDVYRDDRSR